jgi:dTDP-4-dehydrorhamnose reductase
LGADNVAAATEQAGKYLVHVSSGCVQESLTADDVKTEDDVPNPLCYYAWTKVWAENLIEDRMDRRGLKALILRPRQLLSSMASPRNALVKMLTYSKFIDTPNSCTVVEDLMDVTSRLIEMDAEGLFNVANPGVTSPYRIAMTLKDTIKPDMVLEKISKDELNSMTLAKRIDCVLSIDRLEELGVTMRSVEERLPEIVTKLNENLGRGSGQEIMQKTAEETEEKLALAA